MALDSIPDDRRVALHAAVLKALEDDLQAAALLEEKPPCNSVNGRAPPRRSKSQGGVLLKARAAGGRPQQPFASSPHRNGAAPLPPSYALLGYHARQAGDHIKAAASYLASAKHSSLDMCLRHGMVCALVV